MQNAIPFEALQRVLVIKLRHHGDVLLTSPVFSVLKAYAPQARIDALVYTDTRDMISLHPAVQSVHCLDRHGRKKGLLAYLRDEWLLLSVLRAQNYELIVHLTDHPRGAWITRWCGVRWAVTQKIDGRGRWWQRAFTHFYPNPRSALRHTVEKHLDALRCLGLQPTLAERRLSLIPGEAAEQRVVSLLGALGLAAKSFIHIHPASRWHFKCWPVASMAELITRLQRQGHRIILSAAPDAEEIRMIEAILARLETPVPHLAGQLSLKELAALTAQAKLFIGVDSAPMHIAAAVGTPTLALFGPSGDKEWGPWLVPHRVVSSDQHPCRPCGIDGCAGTKVSDCLVNLPVDRVDQAAQELLSL